VSFVLNKELGVRVCLFVCLRFQNRVKDTVIKKDDIPSAFMSSYCNS